VRESLKGLVYLSFIKRRKMHKKGEERMDPIRERERK